MPIPTYTPGYPPDGSSLGQTKATIRNNLDGTFETLAVDHINNNGQPGSKPAGYHTVIHQVTQTNVPVLAGVNQIFSGVPGKLIVNGVTTPTIPPGGDTQLYSLTGAGVLAQLTGSLPNPNGYAWVGGFLLQWGSASGVTNDSSIPFNVTFPNNCFTVHPTKNGVASSPVIGINGFNQSAFTLTVFTALTPISITWIAIGN